MSLKNFAKWTILVCERYVSDQRTHIFEFVSLSEIFAGFSQQTGYL